MAWPVREDAWLDGLEEARAGYAEVANAIGEFERLIMIARPDCAADARRRSVRTSRSGSFPTTTRGCGTTGRPSSWTGQETAPP
jgi:agmatine/peptidylarginine deiminase